MRHGPSLELDLFAPIAQGGALTTYRIVLGFNAPIVEHEARAGSLHIGDEVYVEGVMRSISQLAPFDPDRSADFVAVLAAPPVVPTLNGEHIELYRSELAQLRPELARLADTRGEPAAEALAMVIAVLEENELT
jgi:hypothetical protein